MGKLLRSCGVDIGGTFTDCVLVDDRGLVYSGKAPTTHGRLTEGFFAGLEAAAEKAGHTLDTALRSLPRISHGTTVATNIVVERRGARTAFLTTMGHGDAIFIQRAAGRVAGLPTEDLLDLRLGTKPEPLVPRELVFELTERADANGDVLVELDRDEAAAALAAAREAGAEAIAVCFLWSFRAPQNEMTVKRLLDDGEGAPFASLSSEISPSWGEYERAMTTIINSYVGPDTAGYLGELAAELEQRGFTGSFSLMKSNGGVSADRVVRDRPVTLLHSGPAGALAGSQKILAGVGVDGGNAITTDMGGTSFDVGLIVDGEPQRSAESTAARFTFHLPTTDIVSIGSGGGSIAHTDELLGGLSVGPRSAGSIPGPAAYGRGGVEPTVTDADVVLGYLNPEYFLGGNLRLHPELAEEAVAGLAARLGMSTLEAAAGIRTIVDASMADVIRATTIARGHDPRSFDLLAFGGAGPLHAADYARDLGAPRVIVPRADLASVWSAMGVSLADFVDVQERYAVIPEPFPPAQVAAIVRELKAEGLARLQGNDLAEDEISLRLTARLKYRLQVNAVDVPLESGDAAECEGLVGRFEELYARIFGAGAGFREAGVEITGFTCTARGARRVTGSAIEAPPPRAAAAEPQPSRGVFWVHAGRELATAIHRESDLAPGWHAAGPCIVELPDTTVAVPPDYSAALDAGGSIVLTRGEAA